MSKIIDIVDSQKLMFARAKARHYAKRGVLSHTQEELESWLACVIYQCVGEYSDGLEKICQHMQKIVQDTINASTITSVPK